MLVLGMMLVVGAERAGAATVIVNYARRRHVLDFQCSLRQAIMDVDSPGNPTGNCAPAAFGANTIALGSGARTRFAAPAQLPSGRLDRHELDDHRRRRGQHSDRRHRRDERSSARGLGRRRRHGQRPDDQRRPCAERNAGDGAAARGRTGRNGGAILNQGALTLNDVAVTNSRPASAVRRVRRRIAQGRRARPGAPEARAAPAAGSTTLGR